MPTTTLQTSCSTSFTLYDPNADYSFADVIVVRDTRDGKLYAAFDRWVLLQFAGR